MSLAEACADNHDFVELLRLVTAGGEPRLSHTDGYGGIIVAVDHPHGGPSHFPVDEDELRHVFQEHQFSPGETPHLKDSAVDEFSRFALDRFMKDQAYLRFCSVKEIKGLYEGREYEAPVVELDGSSTGEQVLGDLERNAAATGKAEFMTGAAEDTQKFLRYQLGRPFTEQSIIERLWNKKGEMRGDEFRAYVQRSLASGRLDFIVDEIKTSTGSWEDLDGEEKFRILHALFTDPDRAVTQHDVVVDLDTSLDEWNQTMRTVLDHLGDLLTDQELSALITSYLDPGNTDHPDSLRELYRATSKLQLVQPTTKLLRNESSKYGELMHGYNALLFLDHETPVNPYSEDRWYTFNAAPRDNSAIQWVQGIILLVEERTLRDDYAAALRKHSSTLPIISVDGEPLAK